MKIFKIILAVLAALNLGLAKEQTMINFNELPQAAKLKGELSQKQLAIVAIAAYTAAGETDKLKGAFESVLKAGLSVSEIREVLSHQSAYIGFPMSLNGLIAFNNLIKERANSGIKDEAGKDATPVAADTDFYERGKQTLMYLSGRDAASVSAVFFEAPAVDRGLKEHLFGYLFSRDVLGFVDREIVVVSTLATLKGVNSQLKSHLGIARNLGVSNEQLERVFKIVGECVGREKAENAREVLKSL